MSCFQVGHIALTVESLRQAENLYGRLLGLRVLYREGRTDDGWRRKMAHCCDGKSEEGDIQLERSCLERDGLRLVLQLGIREFNQPGRIDHVCLEVRPEDLSALFRNARQLDCRIEQTSPRIWVIEDPYGIRWWVAPREDEGPLTEG